MYKKLRRMLALFMCAASLLALMSGCGQKTSAPETAGSQAQATVPASTEMLEKQDGVIEGVAAAKMVDKVVATLTSTTFDTSPFSPPTSSMVMKPMLFATLIYRDYYGAPLEDCSMWVAKSVTRVDDVTYDIDMYDYVTDSKGNNIDADDVIFSYEKSAELAQFMNARTNLVSLEKTGDYSLRIVIAKNAPGIIEDLLSNGQFYIVDKDWYENATDDERRNDPAVTGAYQIKEIVPGSSVTLEALDNYWQEDVALRPIAAYQNVKTIVFKAIAEGSMRLIALENGEVDVTSINNSDLDRVYRDGAPVEGFNVTLAGGGYGFSAFLNSDTLTGNSVLANNADLRRAVLYALNSEDIMFATGANEYTGVVSKDMTTRFCGGYIDAWNDQDYFDYNPEKANELREAAGYKPGEVTLRVLTSATLFNDSVRAVMIANLEEAGFKVDSMAVDQALFNTYKNDSTQWDIMLDMKGSSTGNVIGAWDQCFNPAGYTNGSVCFTHDDHLTELLKVANEDPTDANKTAFRDYLVDMACVKGLYTTLSATASQSGILEIKVDGTGVNVIVNALVFAEDFKSAG